MSTESGIADMALFFSAIATGISWFSLRHAKHAAQAQTVAKIMEEYSAPEMGQALRHMRWVKDNELQSPDHCQALRNADKESASAFWQGLNQNYHNLNMDDSRRRVFNFFKKAYRLYEIKYLSKEALKIITDFNGYPLLLDTVWPLTRAHHFATIDPPDAAKFQWLEALESRFTP